MMPSEGESAQIKKVRQVCRCEKCGNEAELEFTCRLESVETAPSEKPASAPRGKAARAKGTATCVHCGNEAEMWIDI